MNINFYKNINQPVQIQGNYNNLALNNEENLFSTKSFMLTSNINFDSKAGINFYCICLLFVLIVWILCFVLATAIAALIAFIGVPSSLFLLGRKYLKHIGDDLHINIHRKLILFNLLSIMLFISVACIPLTSAILLTILCGIMGLNIITSFGLYFNALGGNKILDFIMGGFKLNHQN